MQVHAGVGIESGSVHMVSVTPANVAGISELPNFLREDDFVALSEKG